MIEYSNPVITGFHPDPSVCCAEGKYYLVCSSFQYFPGVPLFESDDLINWKQIGHVLDRPSQLPLAGAGSNGGIYAPTIRYHEGRFYMITTNVSGCGNFYVWTDDIHGAWSEPVFVDRDGIDPSLYFEGDKVYFTSNYTTPEGELAVRQREIDIRTGAPLSEDRIIWKGAGGRYLEGPHLYKINGMYYLIAAEGGTEYGHMVVYARSDNPYGPFIGYCQNPVLTNRNKGDYQLQGVGHGDLICDKDGNWWMVHLAFRQLDRWSQYHILGREVCLTPVEWDNDGWFHAGNDGFVTMEFKLERPYSGALQSIRKKYDFTNTSPEIEWVYLRNPNMENYQLWNTKDNALTLHATQVDLDDDEKSPSMLLIRQQEMRAELSVKLELGQNGTETGELEAGISIYMDSHHHHELAVTKHGNTLRLIKRRTTGDMQYIEKELILDNTICTDGQKTELCISAEAYKYTVSAVHNGCRYELGTIATRYLSSEVAGGFTGVMFGLYAVGSGSAEFTDYECTY